MRKIAVMSFNELAVGLVCVTEEKVIHNPKATEKDFERLKKIMEFSEEYKMVPIHEVPHGSQLEEKLKLEFKDFPYKEVE